MKCIDKLHHYCTLKENAKENPYVSDLRIDRH